MLAYLAQATLDIIGLTGFNYAFEALSNKQTDLSEAVNAVIHPANNDPPIFPILKAQIPFLRCFSVLDKHSRDTKRARTKMDDIGRDLVQRKKKEILAEQGGGDDHPKKHKDLLGLLIRSNMNEQGGGLTEDEVLDQIPTFLLAGTWHFHDRE